MVIRWRKWLGKATFLIILGSASKAGPSGTVTLDPGEDIQTAVNRYPEGTRFILRAGTYRLRSVTPKSGDIFQGELGPDGQRLTILSGAKVLTVFDRQGRYWVATGQTQQGQMQGKCMPTHPRCGYPEDFFFDDEPLQHVAKLADLGPGKYFFDYRGQRIYFVDDPTGHKVETSVARSAFKGAASDVTVQDLIVEKYAAPDQVGAIGDNNSGSGWTVKNNEVRSNHGVGIQASSGAKILNNYVHDNGQLGIGGVGDDILVEGNEIVYNRDYSGTECGWECGGLKISLSNRLTVRKNNVHDNVGPGLWTDGDNINTLYENNTITDNSVGIWHEISYKAIIRNNIIKRNGEMDDDSWVWNAAIQIANSQDVEIYGNTIEVNAQSNGNGIILLQQDRRSDGGKYGPLTTVNNYVHNNVITVTGTRPHGQTGAAQDYKTPNIFAASSNNRFENNEYHVPDLKANYWTWNDLDMNWTQFRKAGQEGRGSAVHVSAPPPRYPKDNQRGSRQTGKSQ